MRIYNVKIVYYLSGVFSGVTRVFRAVVVAEDIIDCVEICNQEFNVVKYSASYDPIGEAFPTTNRGLIVWDETKD